jgi:hypothetical protein
MAIVGLGHDPYGPTDLRVRNLKDDVTVARLVPIGFTTCEKSATPDDAPTDDDDGPRGVGCHAGFLIFTMTAEGD